MLLSSKELRAATLSVQSMIRVALIAILSVSYAWALVACGHSGTCASDPFVREYPVASDGNTGGDEDSGARSCRSYCPYLMPPRPNNGYVDVVKCELVRVEDGGRGSQTSA